MHLTVDKVVLRFKGQAISRQYRPKQHKHFGLKIDLLSNMTDYTFYLRFYISKDAQRAVEEMSVTHAAVRCLTRRVGKG
jgi:hypothetical protein